LHRVFGDVDCPPGSVLQFAQGDACEVLVRLSAQADLLVVGNREPVRRAYLTSPIGHYCISHAACPVVTVPACHNQRQPAHDHRAGIVSACPADAPPADTLLTPSRTHP